MEHVRIAGMGEAVLDAVLQAYTDELSDHVRWHIALILSEYAKAGTQRAFERLCERALQGDAAAKNALEIYPQGIAWLVEHILPRLSIEERHCLKDWLDEVPDEDATETSKSLRQAVAEYQRFCDRRIAAQAPRPSFDPVAFLATPPNKRKATEGWAFASQADEAQLSLAAREFTQVSEEEALNVFYRVFTKRPFPLDPALLVSRADEERSGWAFRAAMSQVDSPLVREYALRLLEERPLPFHAIWSLESSFKPGDEPALLRALQSVEGESDDRLHHHVKCLGGLLEKQLEIDLEPFDHWIYEESPCSTCRALQVRWMIEDDALPEAMIDELEYDVDLELRDEVRAYVAKKMESRPKP